MSVVRLFEAVVGAAHEQVAQPDMIAFVARYERPDGRVVVIQHVRHTAAQVAVSFPTCNEASVSASSDTRSSSLVVCHSGFEFARQTAPKGAVLSFSHIHFAPDIRNQLLTSGKFDF